MSECVRALPYTNLHMPTDTLMHAWTFASSNTFR